MTDVEVVGRLEKLERDNRRLKRLGTSGILLSMMLLVGYAASCSRSRETNTLTKVTAREIDLVDDLGKTRVKIDMECISPTDCWPGISLFDQNGKSRTSIGAGTLNISGDKGDVELLDNVLQFNSREKQAVPGVTARLQGDADLGGALWLFGKDSAYSFVNSDPPGIEIRDSKGFMTDFGAADLTTERTGETSQTSAASIVMFGNDKKGHVIWSAP